MCAAFFALKTELYIEHICSGIMGCDAHWCRYEWQSRGSTHVHYFLWLRDAPLLEFLNEWTKEAISDNAEAHSSNEETGYVDIDEVIDDLNARAPKRWHAWSRLTGAWEASASVCPRAQRVPSKRWPPSPTPSAFFRASWTWA